VLVAGEDPDVLVIGENPDPLVADIAGRVEGLGPEG
jgi:hypothetical protein